ncbi:MAG: hypothetical protein HN742_39030 [Lentisphaerae bacterium]|jgi:3',5'-cyclic AMP phosphodiesterase CpdA|nr:hypothetical protein [Lentisphaerota bacterium]MBT4816008.1 hypothetical protein [Lentisphaerota bacterium]MBT5604531.1 hypothetical protein [Lentisphaerota bacterium]MBT7061926.1 hypothetical protein [Lentisphaerota bacterium]MBT7847926.1 hypothetical protein [Lentisphaerota bacterium]
MSEFSVTMVGDTHIAGAGGYGVETLHVPEADVILGMGDWVNIGTEPEYDRAVAWARSLPAPFLPVRGNHDNGSWNRHAKLACPEDVRVQLAAHSDVEHTRMVEWRPNVWQEVPGTILNLSKQESWDHIPAHVQDHIIKLRDITPGYYRLELGGMLFLFLDASNWLLGDAQMRWLETQVETADRPVVLVSHHHCLPVGIIFDGAQVHERDFLRRLMQPGTPIVAYLHGHAHLDRWWRYGDVDVIGVRNQACRTVTFREGRVTGSVLDNAPDTPSSFVPDYLCAQCLMPGQVSYLHDAQFDNLWNKPQTACLGWLAPPPDGRVELLWSMRLPRDVSEIPHCLEIQTRSEGELKLVVSAPGLERNAESAIAASPEGRKSTLDLGPLIAGHTEVRLRCSQGWGYAAIDAPLVRTRR